MASRVERLFPLYFDASLSRMPPPVESMSKQLRPLLSSGTRIIMPIEFTCPSCKHLLRVPDNAAGKQAQCPQCEQIISVPPQEINASPFVDDLHASPSPAAADDNPFATPAPTDDFQSGLVNRVAPWPNPRMQSAYSISCAWELFKRHALVMIGAFLLVQVISRFLQAVQEQTQIALAGIQRGNPNDVAVGIAAIVFVMLLRIFVQTFVSIGLVRIYLEIARGGTPNFGLLFSGGPWLLRCFGATILYWLMVVVGGIALIVPGIYLGMRFWPYMHFIVDKECSIGEAFSQSSVATQHNMGETLIMMLIAVGMLVLGFVMLCLGLLITMPIVGLAWTIAYLMITAQDFYQTNRSV